MQTLFSLVFCVAMGSGIVYGQTACLQDQYGNQYDFTIDTTHGYLYGTVSNAQSCPASTWSLTGSYVQTTSGLGIELTAANPNGTSDPCFPIYTLKGIWPNFDWYYAFGISTIPQARWVACGTPTSDKATGKGARK